MTGSAEGDARMSAAESNAKAQEATRLLCHIGEWSDERQKDTPPAFQSWWRNHKEIDRLRCLQEEERRRADIARLEERIAALKESSQ